MFVASFLASGSRESPWTTAETPLAEVARIMAATGIGSIPVLDATGRLIGLVTERDILRLAAERRSGIRGLAVEEVMTRDVTMVPAETPLDAALHAMDRSHARHIPVCDGEGRLLGLLGLADLLRLRLAAPAAGPA